MKAERKIILGKPANRTYPAGTAIMIRQTYISFRGKRQFDFRFPAGKHFQLRATCSAVSIFPVVLRFTSTRSAGIPVHCYLEEFLDCTHCTIDSEGRVIFFVLCVRDQPVWCYPRSRVPLRSAVTLRPWNRLVFLVS